MTEVNHRRGSRERRSLRRRQWGGLPAHQGHQWQRIHHKRERQHVRLLLIARRVNDIPGNLPKHIRYDYF